MQERGPNDQEDDSDHSDADSDLDLDSDSDSDKQSRISFKKSKEGTYPIHIKELILTLTFIRQEEEAQGCERILL